MVKRIVLARFRVVPALMFYAAIIVATVFVAAAPNLTGVSISVIWWVAGLVGGLYISYYAVLGLANLIFLGANALYVKNERLIYVSPMILSVNLSNIETVDVDQTRKQWGFAPTVRIKKNQGRTRYIRTEFLDKPADELAGELQRTLAANKSIAV